MTDRDITVLSVLKTTATFVGFVSIAALATWAAAGVRVITDRFEQFRARTNRTRKADREWLLDLHHRMADVEVQNKNLRAALEGKK